MNKEKLNKNERLDDLGINNLKLIQNTEYFCFGTDSVMLANFAKSTSSKNIILDLCTGSGVVPIIFSAKNKYNKIFGVELQSKMYELFERNIKLNNLDIIPINEDINNVKKIREIIEEKTGKNTVDIITVNPPYKPKGNGIINENDIKYIARHEEKCKLEDIFKVSSNLLQNKGKLYIVHKPERLADLIEKARKYKLEPKRIRFIMPDINSCPSIVLVEYSKNGGNELIVEKPIIERELSLEYTKEFLEIYGLDKDIKGDK